MLTPCKVGGGACVPDPMGRVHTAKPTRGRESFSEDGARPFHDHHVGQDENFQFDAGKATEKVKKQQGRKEAQQEKREEQGGEEGDQERKRKKERRTREERTKTKQEQGHT